MTNYCNIAESQLQLHNITIETSQFITENVEKVATSGRRGWGRDRRRCWRVAPIGGSELGSGSVATLPPSLSEHRRAQPSRQLGRATLPSRCDIPAWADHLSPHAHITPPLSCGSRRRRSIPHISEAMARRVTISFLVNAKSTIRQRQSVPLRASERRSTSLPARAPNLFYLAAWCSPWLLPSAPPPWPPGATPSCRRLELLLRRWPRRTRLCQPACLADAPCARVNCRRCR